MSGLRLTRRTFVRGVGAAAITAPFLRATAARAQTAPPKRFIAFFTSNGTFAGTFGSGSATSLTLGPVLAPLEPLKSKITLLDGIDEEETYIGAGAGHQKGTGAFLTGQPLNAGTFSGEGGDVASGWANGISIDQRIAAELRGMTARGSLELGVQVEGSNNRHRIAYSGPDAPLPPVDDPYRLFDDLFADLSLGAGELDRLRRRRQSVLDRIRGDLNRTMTRLGSADRPRLDAHLESIRDIERRLAMTSTATCVPPALGARIDLRAIANYRALGELQMDLMVAAMQCDMTRVATLLWAGGTSNKRFPDLGITAETHHQLSHEGDTNADAQDKMVRIGQWYAERFGYLLQKLDSIAEGGGTMLDNTVILWGSELAKGNTHSRRDMRFVLAGNAGGQLRTGAYLTYGSRIYHNNLLVSIANAMGVSIDRFGHPDFCNGRIENVFR